MITFFINIPVDGFKQNIYFCFTGKMLLSKWKNLVCLLNVASHYLSFIADFSYVILHLCHQNLESYSLTLHTCPSHLVQVCRSTVFTQGNNILKCWGPFA